MKIQAQIMLFVIIFKTMLTDDSLSPWILINIVKNIIQSSLKTRQMQSQPYLLSFFKTMLTDDSLSPILIIIKNFYSEMTCHIVKACHLLGNLTDGSLIHS